jgi:formylmethanofuran dehydrogenase subunit A
MLHLFHGLLIFGFWPHEKDHAVLRDLDHEHPLNEIAIVIRPSLAKVLGLTHQGHPGVGADMAIYDPTCDYRRAFTR